MQKSAGIYVYCQIKILLDRTQFMLHKFFIICYYVTQMKFRDILFSLCFLSFFLLIITQSLKQRLNTRIVLASFLLRRIIMCLLCKVWITICDLLFFASFLSFFFLLLRNLLNEDWRDVLLLLRFVFFPYYYVSPIQSSE